MLKLVTPSPPPRGGREGAVIIMRKNIFTTIISLVVIVLSVIPIPEVPQLDGVPLIDKWVHFVMYGSVAIAMWIDMFFVRKERVLTPLFDGAIFSYPVLLGVTMELVQLYLIPCRNGDSLDAVANGLGCCLGNGICIALYYFLYYRKNKDKLKLG